MRFIFITNSPELAAHAEACGVDRIMVDLEAIGKNERQGHLDTVISRHTLEDISSIRRAISSAELLVRINPIYHGSGQEIEEVIQRGADRLMLPMFKTREEVETFINTVDGRRPNCLLLETAEAMVRVDNLISVPGVNEVHIGLNDLHLALHLDFMFELLSGGIVEYIGKRVQAAGLPFGFGGIGRLGTGTIDAGLILSEHVRLGSQSAILSRSFHGQAQNCSELNQAFSFQMEFNKILNHVDRLKTATKMELHTNQAILANMVHNIIKKHPQHQKQTSVQLST